jgi:membrane-bound lytic murein transglycosylase D
MICAALIALAGAGCSTLPSGDTAASRSQSPLEQAVPAADRAAEPAPPAAPAEAASTDPLGALIALATAPATAANVPAAEHASTPTAERASTPTAERASTPTAECASTPAAERASPPAAEHASAPAAEPKIAPAPDAAAAPAAAGTDATDHAAAPPAEAASTAQPQASAEATLEEDLWQRIRRGFAIPDLETPLAASRTAWYAGQPAYFDRMTQRASLYLFHIVEEIEKRGMPTELALLPFVESAMQPEAVSSARAAGLWQFIPSTGKIFALRQDQWRDERRDVVESTRAALDYLQKLYAEFGHWHLALAAYNWGEGAVARSIARNRASRKPTDYSSLRMPRETRHYVPKLQAIENIVRDPARFGITLPALRNEPYFVAVSKERDIDVATAARLAEMPIDEFRALNPSFNRPVIVGAAQPTLLLPARRADTFHANLAAWEATGQPLASWTTYTMRRDETLAQVARRAGIAEAKLREANRIPPRYRIAPGSTILVPRDDSAEDIAPSYLEATFRLVPDSPNLRQVTHRVRRGETLHSVARRWRVQPDEIIAWNNLRSTALFAGQRLTLTVARPPARPAARPPARAADRTSASTRSATAARAGAKPAAARPQRSATVSTAPRAVAPAAQRPAPG